MESATICAEERSIRRDAEGHIPAFDPADPHQNNAHWRDLLLFNEYYHGDTGQGLGASHQTGWTGLVANLLCLLHTQSHKDDTP
ncbi:MAG: hypothetical protein Fur0026_07170 [Sideroxydans sp.]